jgi:hypothetical protein
MVINQFSSKKIACVVTGKTTVYAGEFLQKKIQEYATIENLEKFYICKEVKALLKKGYKISDVRKILDTPDYVPFPADDVIKEIEKDYQKSQIKVNDTTSQSLSTITSLTYDKSDPEVEEFINNVIIKL